MIRILQNSLNKKLFRELFLVTIVVIFLCSFFKVKAAGRTIEVGKNLYFVKISDAIKNANDGDTIVVYEGIYEENLIINKRISLIAIGKATILTAKAEEPAVTIAANEVYIKGFNITTTNGFFSTAIYIAKGYGLCKIYNNTLMNSYFGIYSDETFRNEIIGNSITNNNFGIMLNYTSESEFKQNKIKSNKYGIVLSEDRKNFIQYNNITNNQYGVYLFNSQNDTVLNNYLLNNIYGIYLSSFSSKTNVKNNTIINSQYAIFIDTSHFNNVLGNEVKNSIYGIYLQNCRYNSILTNYVTNGTVGIQLYGTTNNTISSNTVNKNIIGIEIDNAYSDIVKENTFLNILAHAITMYKTTETKLIGNIISITKNGIVLDSSSSNKIIDNKLNNVQIGIYIYNSDLNSIKNTTIKEAEEWYVRSQSKYYNYVENLMFDSEKLNFSFSGKVAIKGANVSIVPKDYNYLNECVFVNVTQGALVYINFSYSNKPYKRVTVLYTTDGSNWKNPSTLSSFENIKVIIVRVESSGTYALFSYREEKPGGMLTLAVVLLLLSFTLLMLALFFIRKREK